MQIELDADRNAGADHLAHMGEHVAFAVVVAFRHHGAMHGEQHGVDRQRGLEIGHDLVAEGFVDLLHRLASRLGEGAQAFDHLPTLLLGATPPHRERRAEHRHFVAVARLAIEAGFLEELLSGGNGGEGVGLGAEAGGEDLDLFHVATVT